MKTKKQISFFFVTLALTICSVMTSSCDKEVIDASTKYSSSTEVGVFSTYGRFVIVNKGTNDTLRVDGNGKVENMVAHNGNHINISFTPDEKYKTRKFSSTYKLDNKVFADSKASTLMADDAEVAGFNVFLTRYKNAIPLEETAIRTL